MNKPAVVLLSGGIDSSTVLAVALERGFSVFALTVNYGQRHGIELEAARKVAEGFGVTRHITLDVDLRVFGGSALTADEKVPKNRSVRSIPAEIPSTYVPARNTIMLSLALGWAEVIGAYYIFIGVNAVDYSGYPDCRPEFISAFNHLANVATKAGIEGNVFTIEAPLINLSKAEIIKLGTSLGVEYGITLSCYDPSPEGFACGRCDSCLIRRRGFEEAGIDDPTRYNIS